MRKYFLLIFFIILICFNCGYTIKGGVSYTVETARQISFAGVSKNIDIKKYKNYLHDEYFCKNMEAKTHHKNKLKNRSVTFFSDGTYGVVYKSNRNKGYYYDGDGYLEFIEISKTKFYPKKYVRYNIQGSIDTIVLATTPKEAYIFNKDKKLIAHWIGNNCYNEAGELIKIRK